MNIVERIDFFVERFNFFWNDLTMERNDRTGFNLFHGNHE